MFHTKHIAISTIFVLESNGHPAMPMPMFYHTSPLNTSMASGLVSETWLCYFVVSNLHVHNICKLLSLCKTNGYCGDNTQASTINVGLQIDKHALNAQILLINRGIKMCEI